MALEGMLRLPGWHGKGSVERVDRKEWFVRLLTDIARRRRAGLAR
jgi:hypothetical protein